MRWRQGRTPGPWRGRQRHRGMSRGLIILVINNCSQGQRANLISHKIWCCGIEWHLVRQRSRDSSEFSLAIGISILNIQKLAPEKPKTVQMELEVWNCWWWGCKNTRGLYCTVESFRPCGQQALFVQCSGIFEKSREGICYITYP